MPGSLIRRTVGALTLVTCVALPGSAHAVGLGAPGKVAVTGPGAPVRIWDPVQAVQDAGQADAGFTTIAAKGAPAVGEPTLSWPSRPQWSPDGTRLVFAQSAEDPGDRDELPQFHQTSLYLYTVEDGSVRRLTTPPPRLIDDDDDALDEGHLVTDFAPTFTADGKHVAFLRHVEAGRDDELSAHRGTQVWTVPVDGGGAVRRSSFDPDRDVALGGMVSIPGTSSLLVSGLDDDYVLFRHDLGSSSLAEVPGTRGVETVPATIDVAPDGTRFSRTELEDGTLAAAVRRLDGGLLVRRKGTDASAFSPTGNGAIGRGCVRGVCGIVETLAFADDRPRDTGGDEQRIALKFPADAEDALLAVQPQQLPIVFLPGFLGSEIACGGNLQWPALRADALGMRLADDGRTNAGCAGSAPTGRALGSFLSSDVYATISQELQRRFGSRAVVMGWDWRKRAEETWQQLDDTIAQLTATERARAQGVGRVVLWSHSYGGLLARSYLATRPAKVAQLLSVASPFLGSPKTFFPLAFGIETPMPSPMDLLWDNAHLKTLSRNLAGLYALMPSPSYPRAWFSIDGETRTTADMVARLGGNAGLLRQAQADHAAYFDGFDDDERRVDVRAVVGTGMATIERIDLRPYDGEDDDITVFLGNGDRTVPGISANQGPVGTSDPLGDDVRIQFQCDVDHVALANDPGVIGAYLDWADHGAVPLQTKPRPCEAEGEIYDFTPGEIDAEPAALARSAARDDGAPATLAAVERSGLADVLRLPRRTLVVTDRRRTGAFSVDLRAATFRVTPVGADGHGTTVEYGPLTGTATIVPATAAGGLPTITVGGVPVAPHAPAGAGQGPAPGGGEPGGSAGPEGSGGGVQPGGAGQVPPRADGPAGVPPAVTAPGPTARGLRLVGRPRLRGRRLTMRVAVPAKGVLRTRVTERGRTLSRRTTRAARARTIRLALRLAGRPRSRVRVVVTFTPSRGRTITLGTTVRR